MNTHDLFGTKCLFVHQGLGFDDEVLHFEERIVLVQASSLDDAINLGEAEARQYASSQPKCQYIEFISVYKLPDEQLHVGMEVYSIMRKSKLAPKNFIDKYYDDGTECSQ